MKPKKKCNKPICQTLINFDEKYCIKHKDVEDKNKYERNKRYNKEVRYSKDNMHIATFYTTSQWRNARNIKLSESPLCQRCLTNGYVTQAKIVHHIIEVRDDWERRLEHENLESICQACHNKEHKASKRL